MRPLLVVLVLIVAFAGVIGAPAATAAPPNIPPNRSCDYFHYHNGNVQQGTLPGYHWHPCL